MVPIPKEMAGQFEIGLDQVAVTAGKVRETQWKSVHVGDIVEVHDNEDFPADLLCLYCELDDGVCYIKTTNLDGALHSTRKEAHLSEIHVHLTYNWSPHKTCATARDFTTNSSATGGI